MHPPEPTPNDREPSAHSDGTADLERRVALGGGEGACAASSDTILVLEEALNVAKREILTGTVRVTTRTDTRDEVAEVSLDRNVVDVERVPVGRLVDEAPKVRTEGGATIVPVLEERFVVVKQLYLKEELHLRHRVETAVQRVPVQLRGQTAVVERVDAAGRPVPEGDRGG